MKKLMAAVVAAGVLFCTDAEACTNLIVGKKASADGSVIVSYNADSYGMYGNLYRHAGGTHAKGEMRKVYEWDTGKYLGEIPQAAVTYNVVGQMNEYQVSVTETTFGGRGECHDPNGLIDYGSLMYIALERSKTAREAISVMTSLVDEYGYCSVGESFSVCDKNEAWIMEMMGKGRGDHGAVWVAVRIPDECISAHANQSRITRFLQLFPKKDVLYSKDVIKFAREKGFFTGKDRDFSFRDAYAPNDFSAVRYCEARVWSFFNRFKDGMDEYLDYILCKDMQSEMPLYLKPDRQLSVDDVKNSMRDHYEDTPLCINDDLGAGAWNMPYRPTPLEKRVGDRTYFNERPISTQQTGFSFVGQMRNWLPDAVGGIVWWTNDDANMAAYTPIYCSVTEVPKCYLCIDGVQDDLTFSWKSAFWLENTVAGMVYPYYSKIFPDLLRARNELEDDFRDYQPKIEAEALAAAENTADILTRYSLGCATKMMNRWDTLLKYIIVKHLDMAVKMENNGKFIRTEYGRGEEPSRPGYGVEYWFKIDADTDGRYRVTE